MAWNIKQIAIIALLLAILVFWVWAKNKSQVEKIDEQSARIEALQGDLNNSQSQIELLKKTQSRRDESTEILINRMDQEGVEYAEKIKEIDRDDDACHWLDQPLPDVVRKQLRATCNTDDRATPTDPIDSMLRATARINDD